MKNVERQGNLVFFTVPAGERMCDQEWYPHFLESFKK